MPVTGALAIGPVVKAAKDAKGEIDKLIKDREELVTSDVKYYIRILRLPLTRLRVWRQSTQRSCLGRLKPTLKSKLKGTN
jgi:hypothetical protein